MGQVAFQQVTQIAAVQAIFDEGEGFGSVARRKLDIFQRVRQGRFEAHIAVNATARHLRAGNDTVEKFGQLNLQGAVEREDAAAVDLRLDRAVDGGVRVAQDDRAYRVDLVDILVFVNINEACALGSYSIDRTAAMRELAQSPADQLRPPGDEGFSSLVEFQGSRDALSIWHVRLLRFELRPVLGRAYPA